MDFPEAGLALQSSGLGLTLSWNRFRQVLLLR
jgi:hypothetical protein